MNISDIDPNFKQLACQDEGIRYYSCMEDPIEINGMYAPRETGNFLRMPEEYQYDTLYRGADKNYYVHRNGNLYLLKEDDHTECVLNGMDSGMPNKALGQQNLAILDENTFFSQEAAELYLYRVSLAEETEERQEIELVVMDLGVSREWMEASVSQFNNQSPDYYVSLEYRNYIDETGTNLDAMMDASLQDLPSIVVLQLVFIEGSSVRYNESSDAAGG